LKVAHLEEKMIFIHTEFFGFFFFGFFWILGFFWVCLVEKRHHQPGASAASGPTRVRFCAEIGELTKQRNKKKVEKVEKYQKKLKKIGKIIKKRWKIFLKKARIKKKK
jgi:hypothetical protein